MPFVYPSNKYACARCWRQNRDMAYIIIYTPDNRPLEYQVTQSSPITKTHEIRILVCYDHAEEVLNYLTGRGRTLKKLYPKDEKQRTLTSKEFGLV